MTEISSNILAQILIASAEIARTQEKWQDAITLYLHTLEYVDDFYGPKSRQAALLYTKLAEVSELMGLDAQSKLYAARAERVNREILKYSDPEINSIEFLKSLNITPDDPQNLS